MIPAGGGESLYFKKRYFLYNFYTILKIEFVF